jgi:hypothetical protein
MACYFLQRSLWSKALNFVAAYFAKIFRAFEDQWSFCG